MNVEARDSAFPPSVQPGIPRLGRLPEGWIKAPLSRFLREVRRPLKMGNDTEYRLVTVKRSRGGVVERSVTAGRDISVKSQFYVRSGDFLISKRQIVHGACGLVPESLDGSIVSNEYSVLNGNGEIDLRFLSYLSHSRFFQQTCFHSSIGVHVEKMIFKLDRWLSWDFHLPPLAEQQKIAEILSTWDKAIQTTEALLANARTQKRALMQSLLTGTRRFPGFEDHPWREVRLGDLGRCIRGVSYKPDQALPQETPEAIRLYRATNIQMGEIVESDLVFVPAELVTSERILRTGDLAVCMSNGSKHLVGKSAPFRGTDSCHTVGAFCAIFRPHDILEADFVRSLFQSPKFDDQITTSLAGSSINNLKNSDIDGMRFSIPSLKDERLLITQALMTIEDEINRSFVMLDHLRTEKKSLMQQLLTGKRRVVV